MVKPIIVFEIHIRYMKDPIAATNRPRVGKYEINANESLSSKTRIAVICTAKLIDTYVIKRNMCEASTNPDIRSYDRSYGHAGNQIHHASPNRSIPVEADGAIAQVSVPAWDNMGYGILNSKISNVGLIQILAHVRELAFNRKNRAEAVANRAAKSPAVLCVDI